MRGTRGVRAAGACPTTSITVWVFGLFCPWRILDPDFWVLCISGRWNPGGWVWEGVSPSQLPRVERGRARCDFVKTSRWWLTTDCGAPVTALHLSATPCKPSRHNKWGRAVVGPRCWFKNRDNPERLTDSPITRRKPVRVWHSSPSTSPRSTLTKYCHWRRLKQGRKYSSISQTGVTAPTGLPSAWAGFTSDRGCLATPIIAGWAVPATYPL